MMILALIIFSLLGYIIGALTPGAWIARWYGIDDITHYGSGSTGATNVARVLGFYYFFIIFLLDCCKAFFYMKFLMWYGLALPSLVIISLALLIGNSYSIFINFNGGKGIATSFGILLALQSSLISSVFIVWACMMMITKIVGISSVVALISLPVLAWYTVGNNSLLLLTIIISIWGLLRHVDNIKRFYLSYTQ